VWRLCLGLFAVEHVKHKETVMHKGDLKKRIKFLAEKKIKTKGKGNAMLAAHSKDPIPNLAWQPSLGICCLVWIELEFTCDARSMPSFDFHSVVKLC